MPPRLASRDDETPMQQGLLNAQDIRTKLNGYLGVLNNRKPLDIKNAVVPELQEILDKKKAEPGLAQEMLKKAIAGLSSAKTVGAAKEALEAAIFFEERFFKQPNSLREVWEIAKAAKNYEAFASVLGQSYDKLTSSEKSKLKKISKECADMHDEGKGIGDTVSAIEKGYFEPKSRKAQLISDFYTRVNMSPFTPNMQSATTQRVDLRSVYNRGRSELYLSNQPLIPNYEVNAGYPYSGETFRLFPRPTPLRLVPLKGYAELDFKLDKVEHVLPFSTESDLQVAGVKLSEWLRANYVRITHSHNELVEDDKLRAELDMHYSKDPRQGQVFAIMEDKKNGKANIFYKNDEGNWFQTAAQYKGGKIISGSGFTGELDLGELQASTSFVKGSERDVFYVVAVVPSIKSTAMYDQNQNSKSEITGVTDFWDNYGLQYGYFTLDSNAFFGSGSDAKTKGWSAGVAYKDVARGKIYAGSEGSDYWNVYGLEGKANANIFGVEGGIKENAFVSLFMRKNKDGRLASSRAEVGHEVYLGNEVQLRTTFRHLASEASSPKGDGTIELAVGKTIVRIGYDDVSRAAFGRKIGALLSEFRTVNSVSELLAATSSYLNTDVLSDASKPKWQIEVEQKGWGKIRLHKISGNDAGGVSFTTADGAHTFALSTANKGSKPLIPENLSFSYVGEQLHFQVDEEKYTVGGGFGRLKMNATQSLKRGGAQIKGIYNPSDPSAWSFGGILGSFPANTLLPTDMPPQTLFVGGLANKRNFLFERGEASFEAIYLNPNIYSVGISYVFTDTHLGVGFDTNILYMPNIPSFDKVEPFDIRSRLKIRWTFDQ